MTSVRRPSGIVPVTVRNHHGPGGVLLEPAFEAEPLFVVALKLGSKRLRRGDVLNDKAD